MVNERQKAHELACWINFHRMRMENNCHGYTRKPHLIKRNPCSRGGKIRLEDMKRFLKAGAEEYYTYGEGEDGDEDGEFEVDGDGEEGDAEFKMVENVEKRKCVVGSKRRGSTRIANTGSKRNGIVNGLNGKSTISESKGAKGRKVGSRHSSRILSKGSKKISS